MLRIFLTTLALVGLAECTDVDYAETLDPLWTQSDADGSGELNTAEFDTALAKLGIEESIFTLHGGKASTLFSDLDKDNSGGLTTHELAECITRFPSYEEPLVKAFTNGAGEVPTSVPKASKAAEASTAKVEMTLRLAGSVSEIFPGQRNNIKSWFAKKCSVTVDEVIMTFQPAEDDLSRRKLEAGGGVQVDAIALVPDEAAAEKAAAALPTEADAFSSDEAFAGLTVEAVEVFTLADPSISYTEPAIAGACLLIGGILMCMMTDCCGKRNAKKAGVPMGGGCCRECCEIGCCSFYAVKPWAFAQFLAMLTFGAMLFFLYSRMVVVSENVLGLLDTLLILYNSSIAAIQDMVRVVPADIIDTIQQYRDQFELLPFLVLGPGIACMLLLLFASLCPCVPAHKGSYCWTKCVIMFANLLLGVAFAFYLIFAIVALVIAEPPVEAIEVQLNTLSITCTTIPPWIRQMATDNQAAVDQLKAAGQPTAEFQSQLDEIHALVPLIGDGCDYINGFLDAFVAVFLPATCTIVAIFFAYFTNNLLCCAAGCCGAPPKDEKAKDPTLEMTSASDIELASS